MRNENHLDLTIFEEFEWFAENIFGQILLLWLEDVRESTLEHIDQQKVAPICTKVSVAEKKYDHSKIFNFKNFNRTHSEQIISSSSRRISITGPLYCEISSVLFRLT